MSYEFEFDNANKIHNKKYNFEYYELDNFKKNKQYQNNKEAEFINGKYFVIGTDEFLWHYISEALTQYELMLKDIPDLKLFFVNMSPWIPTNGKQLFPDFIEYLNKKDYHKRLAYFEDVVKIYIEKDFDNTYIYSYTNSNFILEKAYIVFDLRHMISEYVFKKKKIDTPYYLKNKMLRTKDKDHIIYNHSPWSDLNNIGAAWQKHGMKLVRERFRTFLKQNNSLPKKIYIDRSDANKKWQYYISKNGESPEIKQRTFNKEYLIKEYFKKIGYTPIIMSNYSYKDQLNFYYNATHIAGLCGTGLLGGFVSNKGTSIIEIYVNKDYSFSYGYLTEIAPVNVISINLKENDGGTALMNKRTFDIIDKYKESGYLGR